MLAACAASAEPGDTTLIAGPESAYPQLSSNGRFVLYGERDEFVRGANLFVLDRLTGQREPINDAETNHSLLGWGWLPQATMSGDGRYVVWCHLFQALIRDRIEGTTGPVLVHGRPFRTRDCDFALNEDGRLLVFNSDDPLVAGDTNGESDVFVLDRTTGKIERISVSSTGAQADDRSLDPAISADGRIVKFLSLATNLVPGDTNDDLDVFVRDRIAGNTTRVNLDASGAQTTGASWRFTSAPKGRTLSADGRFVAFVSSAAIVPGDTNDRDDVFVVDRQSGTVDLVSVSSDGEVGLEGSDEPSISGDGRFVSFDSRSQNLVPGDYGEFDSDVFVRDRTLGRTERASVWSSGAESTNLSYHQSYSAAGTLSADGRFVAFHSTADLARGASTEGGTYLHEVGGTDYWVFSVKPHQADFGEQSIGSVSGPRIFTVRNDGTQPLTLRTVELRGPAKGQFLQSSNCPAAVPAGDQCTVSVRFAPAWLGPKWAVLKVIFDTGGPRPVRTEYLSGVGVQ